MQSLSFDRAVYRLRGVVGGKETTFTLDAGSYRVGRTSANDLSLRDVEVSRKHAILRVTPEGLEIEDLGSRNGSFVDGRRIERATAAPGSKVRFGAVTLHLEVVDADDVEIGLTLEPGGVNSESQPWAASADDVRRTLTRVDPGKQRPRASASLERMEHLPELIFPGNYQPGSSPAAEGMYRQLRQSLRGRLAVLVVGETGVGKERVAKILHESSERRHGPFVAINCAAIPTEMLEAEMFGIGKGVATGVDPRAGTFRLAEGGMLFLDEVGEMAPALQAKLLRALQEKEIQPVGGRPRSFDVRVVAATNADLSKRMEEGAFRRDLYYRLAGHLVEVPPLRRSREDIPGLVEHFLRRFSGEAGRSVRGVTAKALRLLAAYPWPGNVRELEHEIHRLICASTEGRVIDSEMLAHRIRHPSRSEPELETGEEPLALMPRLQELESRLIREALRRADGKQVEAAKLLGISRNGLANKLKRLGLRT